MRIACPACDVTYDVPDARLRPGQSVRCARCGQEWEPAVADAPPELRLSETEQGFGSEWEGQPPSALVKPPMADAVGPDKRLRTAWIASGVALALLFGSALLGRSAVMTAWPASQRLYALLGMRSAVPATTPSPAAAPAKTANAAPAAHH